MAPPFAPSPAGPPPRLLAVGGGGVDGHVRDWSERLLRAARRYGLALEATDFEGELALLRDEPDVTTFPADFRDPDAAARLAAERAAPDGAEGPLVAVTSFRELGVMSAAVAAERVGLRWNPVAAVETVRHKELCRARLREMGLPQPESSAFDAAEDALAFMEAGQGPWVVKPSSSLGSQGVRLVPDLAAAADALAAAAAFGTSVLVEEFVSGVEMSVEGIFVAGRPHVVAFTHKRVAAPPYFVSVGQAMPAPLDEETRKKAVAAVEAALRAVGLTHSVFHVEIWITEEDEIVLGEMHVRPGGDWIHMMVDECYGVDLVGLAIADLAGAPLDPTPTKAPTGAAAAAIVADRAGVLERLEGIEAVAADPRCMAIDVKAEPGEEVGPPLTHYDRLALVVARGDDAGDAELVAAELAAMLRPVIREPAAAPGTSAQSKNPH